MSALNSTLQKGSAKGSVAKPVKWLIAGVELAMVMLVAYLLAQIVFIQLDDAEPLDAGFSAAEVRQRTAVDTALLRGFDPFFRTIAQAEMPQVTGGDIPESKLRLEVFGLRAVGDGDGSAIVKLQDSEQKLVAVGEDIAVGIKLVAVYGDRLELSRSGIREAVYLRPQAGHQARKSVSQSAGSSLSRAPQRSTQAGAGISAEAEAILAQVKALQLSPVRRERRIVGFRLPEALPPSAQLMGLEGEDILMSVNGEPLTSFERLEELEEELSAASSLTLDIERRGEMRRLSLSLKGN